MVDNAAKAEAPPATFEAAMAELEELVQKMEAGSLSLEQSVAAYRRGTELVVFCRDSLARIQQQVSVLEGDLLKPFEVDARGDA
jgi:exodeoxyribonuclease VII small subunit